MSSFLHIPINRLQAQVLQSLLEEFATRDGTDYGEQEVSLEEKVRDLHKQLEQGSIALLFDTETEAWDLRDMQEAAQLLQE